MILVRSTAGEPVEGLSQIPVREELLAHLKREQVEPTARDRIRRVVGTALRHSEQALTTRIAGRVSAEAAGRRRALITRAADPGDEEDAGPGDDGALFGAAELVAGTAPLPKQGFLGYASGELSLRRDNDRLSLRRIWRTPYALWNTHPLVPVAGVVDMYLMRLPWATIPVWLRRDAEGRVAELCVAPFDRFQRLRQAEVLTLPARRAVSTVVGALTWLAGRPNGKRA